MQQIHQRMPVILNPEDELDWLNPAAEAEKIRGLLQPYPEEDILIQREDGQLSFQF